MKKNYWKDKKSLHIIMLIILISLYMVVPKIKIVAAEDICEPIAVTGFNGDFVAEEGSNRWGKPSNFVTEKIGKYVIYSAFYAQKYNFLSCGPGLPDDGQVTSQFTGAKYKLEPYNGNNVLFLAKASSGTLTLKDTEISGYERLNILALSGDDESTVDVTVNFTNGEGVTFAGKKVKGWMGTVGNDYAIKGIGRVDNTGFGSYDAPEKPRLYDIVLDFQPQDKQKQIKSITFNNKSTSTNANLVIFAISGKKSPKGAPDVPILKEVTNITVDSATLNWESSNNAVSYDVDVSVDPSFSSSSILTSYNNVSVNNNYLDLTNLKSETTYYYRVRAKNDFGNSGYSKVGSFTTLPYEIAIIKHPESITVEENNISEALSVSVSTNSKKDLYYTWYLCSDEQGKEIITESTTTSSQFEIPRNLQYGNYYVYCEIYNEDIKKVKSEIAEIHVEAIYDLDISWGEMKFEFGSDSIWDPDTHSYIGEDTYSWRKQGVDGENNKITINNHSSSSLSMTMEYFSKEGAFNKVFDENSSVQGRFYKNNDEASKASEFLDDLLEKLNFGNASIKEVIATDRYAGAEEVKRFETYFAFSGMPDLIVNEGKDNAYEMVGVIKIKF